MNAVITSHSEKPTKYFPRKITSRFGALGILLTQSDKSILGTWKRGSGLSPEFDVAFYFGLDGNIKSISMIFPSATLDISRSLIMVFEATLGETDNFDSSELDIHETCLKVNQKNFVWRRVIKKTKIEIKKSNGYIEVSAHK